SFGPSNFSCSTLLLALLISSFRSASFSARLTAAKTNTMASENKAIAGDFIAAILREKCPESERILPFCRPANSIRPAIDENKTLFAATLLQFARPGDKLTANRAKYDLVHAAHWQPFLVVCRRGSLCRRTG